jgi:hypothetical protein
MRRRSHHRRCSSFASLMLLWTPPPPLSLSDYQYLRLFSLEAIVLSVIKSVSILAYMESPMSILMRHA